MYWGPRHSTHSSKFLGFESVPADDRPPDRKSPIWRATYAGNAQVVESKVLTSSCKAATLSVRLALQKRSSRSARSIAASRARHLSGAANFMAGVSRFQPLSRSSMSFLAAERSPVSAILRASTAIARRAAKSTPGDPWGLLAACVLVVEFTLRPEGVAVWHHPVPRPAERRHAATDRYPISFRMASSFTGTHHQAYAGPAMTLDEADTRKPCV